jgi:DNA polymerase-3 subunit delta
MGYEAAQKLCERVGTDVWLLRSEVEKLALFVHPGGVIHPDHIDEICGETAEVSIFKFTDAFKDRDLPRCVRLLSRLLEQGSDPDHIETMLARELRILLVLKQTKPTPSPEKACAYIFGRRKTYTHFLLRQARAYLQAAEHFDISSLVKCYQSLARADYTLKSTSVEPFVLLERALVVALT